VTNWTSRWWVQLAQQVLIAVLTTAVIGLLFAPARSILDRLTWFGSFLVTVFCVLSAVVLVTTLLWNPSLPWRLLDIYRSNRIRFLSQAVLTLLVLSTAVGVFVLLLSESLPSSEAARLFPTVCRDDPCFIRRYSANGFAYYLFHEAPTDGGPENGWAELTLRSHGDTLAENAGWVLFLSPGTDLSRFQEWRFLIRGRTGGERVGVKAKDSRGREMEVILQGSYLRDDGRVTTRWQEVVIPFADFGEVDRSVIENFSVFSTGLLAGREEQTVHLGQFSLR
jgi:hypothetical protein